MLKESGAVIKDIIREFSKDDTIKCPYHQYRNGKYHFEEELYNKIAGNIEVYPAATLKIIDGTKNKNVGSYKNDNWNAKKTSMLGLIIPYLANCSADIENLIKTDDDYDAVICALTAYFVNKYRKSRSVGFDYDFSLSLLVG